MVRDEVRDIGVMGELEGENADRVGTVSGEPFVRSSCMRSF